MTLNALSSITGEVPDPRISRGGLCRLINVYVGNDRQHYTVHDATIRAVSMRTDMTPGTELVLENVEPASFEIFLHWLYFGKLPVVDKEDGDDDEREYLQLVKAWVLGNLLICFKFQNAVMDALVARRDEDYNEANIHPLSETVKYIYSNTKNGSQLRYFIHDMYIQPGFENRVSLWDDSSRIPRRLLLSIVEDFLDHIPELHGDNWTESRDFYV